MKELIEMKELIKKEKNIETRKEWTTGKRWRSSATVDWQSVQTETQEWRAPEAKSPGEKGLDKKGDMMDYLD